MERMEEYSERESNGIRTELYWSNSFCVLHPKVRKDDLQHRKTGANRAARIRDKGAILEWAPPFFSVSKREIAHACVSTHARPNPNQLVAKSASRLAQGRAVFLTCARLGGPSSFSPNAANMVSVRFAGSEFAGRAAPPPLGSGSGGA